MYCMRERYEMRDTVGSAKSGVEPAAAPREGGGGGRGSGGSGGGGRKVANASCTNDGPETIVVGTRSRAQIR